MKVEFMKLNILEKIMRSICIKYIKIQKERCNNFMKSLSKIDRTTNIDWSIEASQKDYELLCETERKITMSYYTKEGARCELGVGRKVSS